MRWVNIHPETGEPTNDQRAQWARLALSAYTVETYPGRTFEDIEADMAGIENGDDYSAVQDLLTNLLHLATLRGWNIDELLRAARFNHTVELDQEADAANAAE
jgi:hypothetical protein